MRFKKDELEKYKKILLSLRDQIMHQIRETAEEVKQPEDAKGYSQHQADEGTADFEKILSLELSSKERDILEYIERALEKLEEGTYGVCDRTGKDIPKARLDAIPYATMTVQAQEEYEKGLG